MQAAIDRVMQSYGMMVNLTPAQEAEARQKVSNFLKEKVGDERTLAVEGLNAWPRDKTPTTGRSPQHRSI